MKPVELKVARIGNSRGIRIPAATLERYWIGESLVMEERSDGSPLRPLGSAAPTLSWDETAAAMAAQVEEWSAWDATDADGLSEIPWEPQHVAERGPRYAARKPRKKK